MSIKLHVSIQVPKEVPREFDLSFDKPEVTIGRDRISDVQIPLTSVSRKHAKLTYEDQEWSIEDLGSTHGTLVNGQPLGAHGRKLLREGDVIEIVHVRIEFHFAGDVQDSLMDEPTAVVARKLVQEAMSQSDDRDDAPFLLMMNGPKMNDRVRIDPNTAELVLGRADTADVRIQDANVSRKHARIKKEWNTYFIEDLHSKNGVVVNGRRIEHPTKLKDADEIYLGALHLTFVDPAQSAIGRLEGQMPVPLAMSGEETQIAVETPKAPEVEPEPEQEEPVQPLIAPVPLVEAPRAGELKRVSVLDYLLIGLALLVGLGIIAGIAIWQL